MTKIEDMLWNNGTKKHNYMCVLYFRLKTKYVLCRMEVLRLRTTPGIAKVIGMLFCIAGVVNLAFVKGPHFKISWHYFHPFGHLDIQQHHHVGSTTNTWIRGCFLMLLSNALWGLWLVLQVAFLFHICCFLQVWTMTLCPSVESICLEKFAGIFYYYIFRNSARYGLPRMRLNWTHWRLNQKNIFQFRFFFAFICCLFRLVG